MYYNDKTVLFLDGKFIKAADAKTDLICQTLHYGYGVFEGIRAYKTVNGVKIFKAHEHFDRLRNSAALVGIPFQHSAEELLPDIVVPTLVVVGARDGFTPPERGRAMAAAIPSAELLEIPNASHTAPIERPHLVDWTIRDFMTRRVDEKRE